MAKSQKTTKKPSTKAPGKDKAAASGTGKTRDEVNAGPLKTSEKAAVKPSSDKKAADKKAAKPAKEGTVVDRSRIFLRDVRGEMKKVTWPSRSQLLKSTGAVLLAIVILGTYIGLLDWAFRSGAAALGL